MRMKINRKEEREERGKKKKLKRLVVCDNTFPNLLSHSNIKAHRGSSVNTTNQ